MKLVIIESKQKFIFLGWLHSNRVMKFIDTLEILDAVIKALNFNEVLDPDQDWDMVFNRELDYKISNGLCEEMIMGDLTYRDCLPTIESCMYKLEFNHDEIYMRKIACLRNLPKHFLILIKNRLPV